MKKLLPHPFLAAALLIFWLVLQQSFGLGHILLGAVIAIAASLTAHAVIPEPVTVRRPWKFVWFILVSGIDIVASNLAVLRILVSPGPKASPGFVEVPLELNNTFGLAVLACILTANPGSAWLEHDRERSTVLIHVLDLENAEEWIATIKKRYEAPLMEIFQ